MIDNKLVKFIFYSILVAGVYYASGLLVRPYILPPTYAAPIWPAAGIASGIVILWGYKYIPAIVVGEILINYNFYIKEDLLNNPVLLTTYLILLLSVVIRVGLGAYLVNKFLGKTNNYLTLLSIAKLLILAGLIPTLITSLISSYTLAYGGLLDKKSLFINFMTWWSGDAIGIFIVLPILFVLFKKPRKIWNSRLYKTLIPVLFSFVLLIFIAYNLKQIDKKRNIEILNNNIITMTDLMFDDILNSVKDLHRMSKKEIVKTIDELYKKNDTNKIIQEKLHDTYFIIHSVGENAKTKVFETNTKSNISKIWKSQRTFSFMDHDWIIDAYATPEFHIKHSSWLVWWLLTVGFLFISMLGAGLLVITGHNILTQNKVNQRTKEINTLNSILVESENRYKQLIEVNPVIFWKHIIGNEKYDFISDEAVKILGYTKEEMSDYKIVWNKMFHPDDKKDVIKKYYEGIKSRNTFTLKYRAIKKNGDVLWFKDYISTQTVDGKLEVIGLKIDITKEKLNEDRVTQLAYYDSMTKLPNRAKFMEYLNEAIDTSNQGDLIGAVLYLDLDRFKVLNDSMGHYFGDQLLIQIGERLKLLLRKNDISSRFGGDEFVVLIRNHNISVEQIRKKALQVAHKIQSIANKPFEIDGHEFFTSFSIGISIFPNDSDDANKILQQADIAMYESKTKGKNTISFFEPEMQIEANRRLTIEKTMKFALEKQEFEMYYQPIFNLDKKIIRLEALIRWNHPKEGVLSPASFIKIAEETGFIVELSVWIIDNVFWHMHKLKENGQKIIPVSINVSLFQFKNTKIIEDIERIAKKYDIDTSLVALELTESVGIENLDDAIDKLNKLKELGFKVAIDDFGSGYSSLNYLTKMPIDMLKLDKSFLASIDNGSNAEPLIEIILLMANKLDLEIIVEGVETQKQFDLLVKLDCKAFQGYLFSRAVPYKEIEVLLEKES